MTLPSILGFLFLLGCGLLLCVIAVRAREDVVGLVLWSLGTFIVWTAFKLAPFSVVWGTT